MQIVRSTPNLPHITPICTLFLYSSFHFLFHHPPQYSPCNPNMYPIMIIVVSIRFSIIPTTGTPVRTSSSSGTSTYEVGVPQSSFYRMLGARMCIVSPLKISENFYASLGSHGHLLSRCPHFKCMWMLVCMYSTRVSRQS